MSMSKWWAWLAAAVSLVGPLPAAAQQAPDYGRPGFFGGMHFVYGYEDFDRPGGVDVDDSQGLSAHLGYRVDSHFSLEIEWEYMVEFDLNDGSNQSELASHSLMVDARFYPLATRIQPFLKAGFGLFTAIEDEGIIDDGDAFGVRAGGGVDFYVTDHIVWTAGVDYVVPATDVDEVRFVSIRSGVTYRF